MSLTYSQSSPAPEILAFSALSELPPADREAADRLLDEAFRGISRKIIVLDDDPTGIQTVHDVSVYTDWSPEAIRSGFDEERSMFFILTNSRSFSPEETEREHRLIAERIAAVSAETGKEFILISRGDSTLRGHFPLETETLRRTLEERTGKRYDGEIICPYFKEGGRFTVGNVHYVRSGNDLVPAGLTEFAKDKTFGYRSSDLREWCEEKTEGAYPADSVLCVSIDDLRANNVEKITDLLCSTHDFGKVIVNAACEEDVKIFAAACLSALKKGKEFIFRTAAAVPKVLGRISDRPLLTCAELKDPGNRNGGIILVGSHVNRTTRQLEALKQSGLPIDYIEFNQHLVLEEGGLEKEAQRVSALCEQNIENGRTSAVYTRRDRLDLPGGDKNAQLKISVEISDAVTSVISRLRVRPAFIIAKGGITSSDVGTKALKVRRAEVAGQIAPGIPVWKTGEESKFPGLPYVIFPGNVGEDTTLMEITRELSAVSGTDL